MWKVIAAIAAVMALAGCSSGEPPPEQEPNRSTTSARAAPAQPSTTSRPPMADVDFSDEADVEFLAGIRTKGVPVAENEDAEFEMITAGQGVCLMMVNEGEDLITSSAWVMDSYEVTGDQAGDIATTAIDVYCPQASSLR